MKKTVPRIEREMTKLVVPHQGKSASFAYPLIGPGTYNNVGYQILKQRMGVPTGDYMASLLHAAYCVNSVTDEPEFKDIKDKMRNDWLWVFNKVLWTFEGVYVVSDLEATGRSQPLNQNALEKALKNSKEINGVRISKDKRVRFAEKGSYNIGDHTPESLAKDGFVIASYGIEGAKKLGEVSTKFKHKPKILGLNVGKEQDPQLAVSALCGRISYGDSVLVNGRIINDYGECYAIGILK